MKNSYQFFSGRHPAIYAIFFLAAAGIVGAAGLPEQLSIDSLSNRYTGVLFDHRLHADYAACGECHHHTTGDSPADPLCAKCHQGGDSAETASCSGCHPAQPFTAELIEQKAVETRYHIDIPGLQGAYHLNCRSCHEAIGGPTGCLDCHQRQS